MAPAHLPALLLPQAAACNLGVVGCRELPDVSALAGDPYSQYCSARACGGVGNWVGFGGTSLAAPSWGAAVLLSEPPVPPDRLPQPALVTTSPAPSPAPSPQGTMTSPGPTPACTPLRPRAGFSMATGLGYLGGQDLTGSALCGPSTGPTGSRTSTGPPGGVAPTGAHGSPPAPGMRPAADVAVSGTSGHWRRKKARTAVPGTGSSPARATSLRSAAPSSTALKVPPGRRCRSWPSPPRGTTGATGCSARTARCSLMATPPPSAPATACT